MPMGPALGSNRFASFLARLNSPAGNPPNYLPIRKFTPKLRQYSFFKIKVMRARFAIDKFTMSLSTTLIYVIRLPPADAA